jgi:hypothetical protein
MKFITKLSLLTLFVVFLLSFTSASLAENDIKIEFCSTFDNHLFTPRTCTATTDSETGTITTVDVISGDTTDTLALETKYPALSEKENVFSKAQNDNGVVFETSDRIVSIFHGEEITSVKTIRYIDGMFEVSTKDTSLPFSLYFGIMALVFICGIISICITHVNVRFQPTSVMILASIVAGTVAVALFSTGWGIFIAIVFSVLGSVILVGYQKGLEDFLHLILVITISAITAVITTYSAETYGFFAPVTTEWFSLWSIFALILYSALRLRQYLAHKKEVTVI